MFVIPGKSNKRRKHRLRKFLELARIWQHIKRQNKGNIFQFHIIADILRVSFTFWQYCSQNHKKGDLSIDFHRICLCSAMSRDQLQFICSHLFEETHHPKYILLLNFWDFSRSVPDLLLPLITKLLKHNQLLYLPTMTALGPQTGGLTFEVDQQGISRVKLQVGFLT